MSKTMEVLDITPELLETALSTLNTENEKELTRQIVGRFLENGLPVRVKQYHQACMKGTYRIMCFIKKSAEAVIINNRGMGRDGVNFQVRIEDQNTLDRLNSLSENVKNQIVNAANCGNCSSKCEGKKYTFTHQGAEHTKCRFICSNFSFQHVDKNDVDCLMGVINNEIAYKQACKK